MGSRALEVDQCRSVSGSPPQAGDSFHHLAPLPPRLRIGERKRVLELNELALYSNLHIALQRFMNHLERGHNALDASNVLGTSAEDMVTKDSFARVKVFMSGSAPSSFYSALDRAWPAREDYSGHPPWWAEYLPKRADYSLPTKLLQSLKNAERGTAGLTSALQGYYAATATGSTAEQLVRLQMAKHSLELVAEMVRFKNPAIRDRVNSICSRTEQLLNKTATGEYSDEFEVAARIAVDYLPHTVKSYLDIPTDHAPLQSGGGRSARDLTAEQLDMISTALDEAISNREAVEAGELLANRHFLESRFGRSSLDIPRQPAPPDVGRAEGPAS